MTSPSRRTLLIGGGIVAAGAGAFVASRGGLFGIDNSALSPVSYSFEDTPQCLLTAFVEEGPYYVEEALIRSDVREDRQGLATQLHLKVVDGATCEALPGATVDIWHCDAEGNYSAAPSFERMQRTSDGHLQPEGAARFLRGRQIAGNEGIVSFTTIYPGWYPGRTPHIHLKVYLDKTVATTTQLFFPKELSNEIYASGLYAKRGQPETTNSNDGVLANSQGANGGWPKMAKTADGLSGSLTIGVKQT